MQSVRFTLKQQLQYWIYLLSPEQRRLISRGLVLAGLAAWGCFALSVWSVRALQLELDRVQTVVAELRSKLATARVEHIRAHHAGEESKAIVAALEQENAALTKQLEQASRPSLSTGSIRPAAPSVKRAAR
jgi:hypothetical protein